MEDWRPASCSLHKAKNVLSIAFGLVMAALLDGMAGVRPALRDTCSMEGSCKISLRPNLPHSMLIHATVSSNSDRIAPKCET